MSTARCYTCHTLRPLHEFPYRRKDKQVSITLRLRRYLCGLIKQPALMKSARSTRTGVVYRYRCVHPRLGPCPIDTRDNPQLRQISMSQVEVQVQGEDGAMSATHRRRRSEYDEGDLGIEAVEEFRATQQALVTKNEITRKRLGEVEEVDGRGNLRAHA
ncbi:hypothetical protein FB567DRAFT_174109 [Paraphoma chrysanthemicola]|uniref:Uncharacterized protein n=1 Tax=Paraphoma chrysanthemicola TaxID=798071 RepID=A0A8K0RD89_9PLEO|nr:hypothetical protein FB567DRAFT_174109 [Paraphoma chrysanthemicola]